MAGRKGRGRVGAAETSARDGREVVHEHMSDRDGRAVRHVGLVVAAVLAATGALHVLWTFSTWPLPDQESFARTVVGVEPSQSPSPGATLAVAAALFAAAYLVAVGSGVVTEVGPAWAHRAGEWTVSIVLLFRGGGGLLSDVIAMVGRDSTTFTRWDIVVYSPLCVALGLGAAFVARGALRRQRRSATIG